MSWHFSQAWEAEYSADNSSVAVPSAPSKLMNTAEESSAHDRTTEVSHRSRFGTTSEPSTADHGAAALKSFLAAFPVREFQSPEKDRDLTILVPGFGQKWRESSVKYDLDSSSWKTHRCLFTEDLPESSVILPKWGLMRGGELWERTTPGLTTNESESGLWPTPTVSGNYNRKGSSAKSGGRARHGSQKLADAGHHERKETLQNGRPADVESRTSSRRTPTTGTASGRGRVLADAESQRLETRPPKEHGIDEASRSEGTGEPRGIGSESSDWRSWWETEPAVGRVANGAPNRVDRLRALGNGQVPAVAALAWRILAEEDGK